MWIKERKIIEGLAKLYPEFRVVDDIKFRVVDNVKFLKNNKNRAYWVSLFCVCRLGRRIPSLEKFIKKHCHIAWYHYNQYFKIEN